MKDNYDRSLDQAREQVHRLNTFLNTLPVRTAGGHFEDVRKYERILEGLTEILDAKRYENVVDAVRDLIERNDTQRELIEVLNGKANLSDHWKMQYDIARQKQLEAEQRAGMAEACCGCDNGGHHVLPKPDPKNPLHWSFASGLVYWSGLPGAWSYQDLQSHAQGLARETGEDKTVKTKDDAVEKAVTAYFDAAHNGRPKNVYPHVKSGMEAALNAAAAEWAEVNK
ncbi:hypothetical protein SEA_TONIANN_96 [Gordonia phage Toniann]|nr:hypothetical protein SEA_TONIANN_96 [Gordonia phage Toniann]